jgi:hypothetical protein
VAFLAPNWVESLIAKEVTFVGRDAPDIVKGILKGNAKPSVNARGIAGGLAMYLVATQLLNLASRGHMTFDNEEEGHKWDAWVPDVTGKTNGYFISPMSVFAEMAYDVVKYSEKKETVADIAQQIISNKLGPVARSANIMWTGQDVFGMKLRNTWDRVQAASIQLAPIPIFAGGFTSPFPGMAQKQLMAFAGVKADFAPNANQQMINKAKKWLEEQGLEAEAPSQQIYYADSPWKKFRMSLKTEDLNVATEAVEELLRTHNIEQLKMQLKSQGGARPFTGNKTREAEFIKTLSPQEQDMYKRASQERADVRDKGLAMLDKVIKSMPPQQYQTVAQEVVKKFRSSKKDS